TRLAGADRHRHRPDDRNAPPPAQALLPPGGQFRDFHGPIAGGHLQQDHGSVLSRHDGHLVDRPHGGRNRGHEHHARLGDRADPRNRGPQGARGPAARHPVAVPGGGHDPHGDGRDSGDRRRDRGGILDPRPLPFQLRRSVVGNVARLLFFDRDRAFFRDL